MVNLHPEHAIWSIYLLNLVKIVNSHPTRQFLFFSIQFCDISVGGILVILLYIFLTKYKYTQKLHSSMRALWLKIAIPSDKAANVNSEVWIERCPVPEATDMEDFSWHYPFVKTLRERKRRRERAKDIFRVKP